MSTQRVDFSRLFFVARGAVQPLLYSWLLFLVFSLFFYAITASAPMLGDATWGSAASFTTCLWFTAFGGRCAVNMGRSAQNVMDSDAVSDSLAAAADGSVVVDDGYIQLMPLTLTFLVAYALVTVLRRRLIHTWGEIGVVVAVYSAVTGILGLFMRLQGAWWIGIVGAGLCAGLCALWAGKFYLFSDRSWWGAAEVLVPRAVGLIKLLSVCALVVCVAAIIAGFPSIIDLHKSYMAGVWGSIGLVLIQFLYLPTILMWVFSWLVGAGFSVGEGSYFSIFGTQLQPIPAIPIFGALPHNGAWAALVLIPVVFAIVWRGYKDVNNAVTPMHVSLQSDEDVTAEQTFELVVSDSRVDVSSGAADKRFSVGKYVCHSAGVAVLVVSVVVVLGALSRGALGPERMLVVGPRSEFLLAAVLAVVALPYVLVSWIAAWYKLRELKKSTESSEIKPDGNPILQDGQRSLGERAENDFFPVGDNGDALRAADNSHVKRIDAHTGAADNAVTDDVSVSSVLGLQVHDSRSADANNADADKNADNEEQDDADSL